VRIRLHGIHSIQALLDQKRRIHVELGKQVAGSPWRERRKN